MSQGPPGGRTSGRRMDGPGVAAACLGICLLAGTALSGWVMADRPSTGVGSPRAVPMQEDETRQAPAALTDWLPAPTLGRADTRGERATPPPLDINRADATALEALPGIGPALARRIVAHRDRHGPFATPLDLVQVAGVGAKRYSALEGRITTAGTP